MKDQVKQEVINISKMIFDDGEYSHIERLINNDDLNELRLYVSDKLEFFELMFSFDRDNEVLKEQIKKCNELDNIVIDCYIEKINMIG